MASDYCNYKKFTAFNWLLVVFCSSPGNWMRKYIWLMVQVRNGNKIKDFCENYPGIDFTVCYKLFFFYSVCFLFIILIYYNFFLPKCKFTVTNIVYNVKQYGSYFCYYLIMSS